MKYRIESKVHNCENPHRQDLFICKINGNTIFYLLVKFYRRNKKTQVCTGDCRKTGMKSAKGEIDLCEI